jgi:hypothetical protein
MHDAAALRGGGFSCPDALIPYPIDHDLRPPKAGERPNGRRRLCGEAKLADARAGV